MKENKYTLVINQIKEFTSDENNLIANLANISAVLFQNLYHITWSGFYLIEKDDFVLGPFQGKPAKARISRNESIFGKCLSENDTIIIKDIHEYKEHMICDPDTNSEIAVPLKNDGLTYGIMYLGSYKTNDFDETDKTNLEYISELISSKNSIHFQSR
ncbi:MAG: GAF domain-containing protein [Spirochaetes bacterium]|nr:GAF domain-containing protein [Spirochaetota bacterium]